MRIKKSATLLLLALASVVLGLNYISKTGSVRSGITFGKNDNYDALWKRVDSCSRKGLTESALKVVEHIYDKAKTENNAPQFVKAILHRMKFENNREEFALEKSIIRLRDEAAAAKFPIKPILQSILADSYWQYFNNNRWKFYNRTQTVNFKNDDITTWDLKTITYEAIKNYKASLENVDSLKRTKVDIYDDIMVAGSKECREWRPTLYDFVGHRALSFFMSTEPDVARPATRFTVNDDVYLKPYDQFLKVKITNPSDSLETKYYALQLMQDLTRFHEKEIDMDALIDVELQRLDYINSHSQNAKKDTLFLTTMKELQDKFASSPRVSEVDYRIATWYFNKASMYQPLNGDAYKWYKKTAHELCKANSDSALTAKFKSTNNKFFKEKNSSYGAAQCKNLITSIESQVMNMNIEQVNEPEKPFRAIVTSTNIKKLYFKVVKTSHLELRKIYRHDWGQKLYEKLNTLPTVKTFTQAIIDDGDYQSHNMEIKMPELPYGYYIIISSINPDFKYSNNLTSYAQCIVSDITTIERNKNDGSHDFYALHRQTGEPLKGISAQVWYEKYNYVIRDYEMRKGELLKTNEKGFFNVALGKEEDRSFFVELLNGKDSYFNDNSYYNYKPYDNDYVYVKSFLFTDRAIYRPGQTVFFKSIVLEGKKSENYKIKANYPMTVTFYDVNHQKISSMNLTTNEYGTISGSFIAPQGVLNGQMYIHDGYGTVYFSVEDYKRPKFEVKFQDVKGSYRINDSITVSGIAKAYAGNVIDGARVKYRVVRNVSYPYWWWWYRSYYSRGNQSTEILNGEVVTNDTGGYVIKFKALPDESVSKKSQATYNYQVMADVTDINGETHSTSTNATVGYQALKLNISTDGTINKNEIKPFRFSTPNLNGVPEPTKGEFAIYKLKQPDRVFRNRLWTQPDRHALSKEEYYKDFPYDLYADEQNKYKWEKDAKVLDKTFDTGSKTEYDLAGDLKSLKPGVYVIEANCKDKFGEEVKAFEYFTLFDPSSSEMPEILPEWYYTNKSDAEPGDKIQYIYASGYANTHYMFELEHKGKAVSTKTIAASMGTNEIAIEEIHRGNVSYHATFIKHNRLYRQSSVITVPYTNKELDITFETFRNKLLPGEKEEWKVVIKDKKGDKMAAELMTAMYDASLDAFRSNYWSFDIYNTYYAQLSWNSTAGQQSSSYEFNDLKRNSTYVPYRYYDRLNYFGLYFYSNYRGANHYYDYEEGYMSTGAAMDEVTTISKNSAMPKGGVAKESMKRSKKAESSPDNDAAETEVNEPNISGEFANGKVGGKDATGQTTTGKEKDGRGDLGAVKARSNFNETAFFYPELQTNEKGETVIKFTIPESLTKWKVMGLAHTKDLKIGRFQKEVITQKELMVQPNAPRFFREGDKMTFIAKISNLSNAEMKGSAELKLYDALSDKEISTNMIEAVSGPFPSIGYREFMAKKGQSTSIEWNIAIPFGYSAIKYKIVAKGGNFSDGEEMALPVLTNRMLVTESMPLPIRSNQTKEFNFEKFISQNNNSTTLKNHAYTLEFTANPAWYAVQALPYIMEYPYECAEQTFARYYANSLATYVANSKPKIKAVFESWKNQSPEAFLSNLEKNQELKAVVLEETPWVLQAKSETENKKRVGLLFDLNRMASEQTRAFRKLKKAQTSNGGFWWFEGGPDDWYITQHIACGFGHLDKLGVLKLRQDNEAWNMMQSAVRYCDNRMREEYEWVKKYDKDYKTKNHLSYMAIQYLYMRSFYKDINMDNRNKEHFEYYKKQEQTYWLEMGRYAQGMAALSLHRYEDVKTPKDILKSLKENSLNSEEMGMYWKENYGYYWYQAPIEQQAMMIEAFDEVINDQKSVDDLKTWLIKSKQTQHWGTTRSTTEAVYALLLKGTDWLSTEPNVEITVGSIKLDPKSDPDIKVEPGTGYFKKVWTGSDIKPDMGKIKVQKKDQGVSWGAVYWQYFEQLDKITPHETPLKLKKQLFLQKNTASGPVIEPITESTKLKLGDKIKVRIELRVDRDMDYVHMKDMRAAGFEPTNVFSGYKWQDGLGYYESTRDAATHFFFSKLHKGTFVFEYPVVVNHLGDFSNGITQIQCMYAPEFTSHSEGIRVKTGK
ncbi:MAG: hypothetical protein K0S32_3792 [Bacteroidetes bacterium]|nr:hypothetical protein [Bacteroidota bacterium]